MLASMGDLGAFREFFPNSCLYVSGADIRNLESPAYRRHRTRIRLMYRSSRDRMSGMVANANQQAGKLNLARSFQNPPLY